VRSFYELDLSYIHHSDFDTARITGLHTEICRKLPQDGFRKIRPKKAPEIENVRYIPRPTFVLTGLGEHHMFRKMNYCFYLASQFYKKQNKDRLWLWYRRGISCRNLLVFANVGLIGHFMKRMHPQPRDSDDCKQIAVDTLFRCIRKFDFTKQYKFSSYCGRSIRNGVYKYWKDSALVEVGTRRAYNALHNLEYESNDLEYAEHAEFAMSIIHRVFGVLSPHYQQILCMKFGLFGYKQYTNNPAIANKLGLTRQRIDQIFWKSVSYLRKAIDENLSNSEKEALSEITGGAYVFDP